MSSTEPTKATLTSISTSSSIEDRDDPVIWQKTGAEAAIELTAIPTWSSCKLSIKLWLCES